MADFFRCSLSLSLVILFVLSLLPFCQSRDIIASKQLTKKTTMADLNFTCPAGGKWYTCPLSSTSKFVGCCATDSDPCSKGCAEGNLRTVSFDAAHYGEYADASCGFGSAFYTCAPSQGTFWGCCKSNPCSTNPPACPSGNLAGAFIDQPAQAAFYVSSQAVSSVSSTSTSSATSAPTSGSDGGSKPNGAVIGGAVGGAVGGLLILGLIVFFLLRRRRNQKAARGEHEEVASPMKNEPKAFASHSSHFAGQSPPPTYSATNGDCYQSMTPQGKANPYTQSPYSQGQWAHTADGPQEMEADVGPSNRYSELPAEVSRPGTHHRYSELSTGPSCRVSPHHSPKASQNENTIELQPQGLGVVTEGSRP